MSLIEQLGGYEKARELIRYAPEKASCFETYPLRPRFYMSDIGCNRAIRIEDLKRELLEYRRAHNIFEEGDLITYNESDFIYKIDTLNRDGLHATTVHQVKRCIIALFGHDNIQHATDEEIAAGHRL